MKKTIVSTKRLMIVVVAMLTMTATSHAMSYEQARNEALFLTDKMAYELNLTDEQYEAAYEINLDYLMGVTSYDDVYGNYWERRNMDLSYILLDWQWEAFRAATYFYRPLYWRDGFWHFGIYARYPHRDYFYFGRPVFYASYRGGHAWHVVGGHGYYYGRRDHFRPIPGRSHFGMLDRWNRGDYRNHHHMNRDNGRDSHFGGNRNSSTRTTVNGRHNTDYNRGVQTHRNNGSLGGYRSQSNRSTSTEVPSTNTTNRPTVTNSQPSHNNGSFSTNRNSNSGSLGGYRSNSGNRTSNNSGAFGGSRSSNSTGSFGGSRSSGNFSNGGATRSSGSTHSSNAGRSSGGGHSYGGRR